MARASDSNSRKSGKHNWNWRRSKAEKPDSEEMDPEAWDTPPFPIYCQVCGAYVPCYPHREAFTGGGMIILEKRSKP